MKRYNNRYYSNYATLQTSDIHHVFIDFLHIQSLAMALLNFRC